MHGLTGKRFKTNLENLTRKRFVEYLINLWFKCDSFAARFWNCNSLLTQRTWVGCLSQQASVKRTSDWLTSTRTITLSVVAVSEFCPVY